MTGRRTRTPSSRGAEPTQPQEAPVARQTRSSSKRAGASGASPASKSTSQPQSQSQSQIPQRGTRRRRRKSIESIATDDFFADNASLERPLTRISETMSVNDTAAANIESQIDSYEDRAARLQDILDFDLPKLCRWCERAYVAVASLTDPEPTAEERRNLKAAKKSFKMARRSFAEDGGAYINLSSSDLPYQDDPDAHAIIQKAICSANLISLLLLLIDVTNSKEFLPFLQELDDAFSIFLRSDLPAQSETYELAFRVRCGRLVQLLKEKRDVEPRVLATTVFCEQPANTPEEAGQRLRKGPFREFAGVYQGGDYVNSEAFEKHMNGIINISELDTNQGKPETEEAFNALFPLDDLLKELRTWAEGMYVHVNKAAGESDHMPKEPGKGGTIDVLEREESESLFVAPNAEVEEESDSESESEHEEYNQLNTVITEPSFIQDPAALAAVRQSERGAPKRRTIEPQSNQQTVKGKQTESQTIAAIRRLDASQILGSSNPSHENGGDMVPLRNGDSQSLSHCRSRSSSHSSTRSQDLGATRKRTAPGNEEPVDDNDDFEVNEQLIDESRRFRYEEPRPAPKRTRFSNNNSRKAGDRLRSFDDTPADTNLRRRDIIMLSQAARATRFANKERGHQIRERWTDSDTDHLLDLIADPSLNCSWSVMEKKGGFRIYRNQQAIRDKARNLKKGYLCADAILPSGFDFVYLSRKERGDVIASGHNPDRLEEDIDEDGQVINNLWRERSS
ncbi:hypothetical protein HD806DRAFT_550928 [Xylariaceae sp. AK1471]|nr:hypothetical protein HD806DRAFT_550928 [Xylariaceae sp. AK1471]